jgi:hypothetical protein
LAAALVKLLRQSVKKNINVSILLPAAPPDAADGWPAYCFTSDNEKVTRIFHSPDHQSQLILFSLDGNLDHTRIAAWFGDRFLCGGLLLQARHDRSSGQ